MLIEQFLLNFIIILNNPIRWGLSCSVCVYGGGDRKAQINNIETGVEIIIATPGRLNDLVEAKVIDVNTITFLILDEGTYCQIIRMENEHFDYYLLHE